MSGGGESVVVNLRERATSGDVNRLQALLARGRSEALRYLLDVDFQTDDLDAGAVGVEHLTTTNPLRAEILGGLLVRPQIGSLVLAVDPGLAYVVNPDGSPSVDDSVLKEVADPGVPSDGSLVMAANPSGSIRIDVIECQRLEVTTNATKDIYDPSSQVYVATSVTKSRKSVMTYRVRVGSPGAGFPGTAAGWLPLMVASVAAGATSCNQMTFWDVRPLINDRVYGPGVLSNALPRRGKDDVISGYSATSVAGVVELAYKGRRLGGRLRRGTPGTVVDAINLRDVANQDPACAGLSTGDLVFLYFVTPFGLPRWARYTDVGFGSRIPQSPRGIPVLSPAVPTMGGALESIGPLTMPASLGFNGATTFDGVLAATTTWNAVGPTPRSFTMTAAETYLKSGEQPGAAGSTGSGTETATIVANTHMPPNARAVLVDLTIIVDWTNAPPNREVVAVSVQGAGSANAIFTEFVELTSAAVSGEVRIFRAWLPLENAYPLDSSADAPSYDVIVSLDGVINTYGLNVVGWRT